MTPPLDLSRDAMTPHLAMWPLVDVSTPPAEVAAWLTRALSVRAPDEDMQRRYIDRYDGPQHGDAARTRRYGDALDDVRARADRGEPVTLDALARTQGLLLGLDGAAPLRVSDAFARGGAHRYPMVEGFEAIVRERLTNWSAPHLDALVAACGLYLDVIFTHPFDDGNARREPVLRVGAPSGAQADASLRGRAAHPERPGRREGLLAHGAPQRRVDHGPHPTRTPMTMDPDSTLPPWPEVRDAIMRFDAAQLREALTAFFATARSNDALGALLTERAGSWYGKSGWRVGNESFGSCWCHSPVVALGAKPRDSARVTPAVDWVVREVTLMADCLRALAALFDSIPPDARRDRDAIAIVIDRAIDEVIERTGCQESWYLYAGHAITWLCDALGVPRGSIESVVESSINTVFSSWTAPAPGPREAAVRAVGSVITARAEAPPADLAARAASWLRPKRPRRAEALSAIDGLKGTAAAEVLVARGLLDESWVDPSRHAFADFGAKARPTPRKAGDALAYALLASDADGAARAESLAHEVSQRLAPYGRTKPPKTVAWLLERDVPGWGYRRFLTTHATMHLLANVTAALSGADDPQLNVEAWARAVGPLLPPRLDARALRARCIEASIGVQMAVNAQHAKFGYESAAIAKLWCASRWWTLLAEAGLRTPARDAAGGFPLAAGDLVTFSKMTIAGTPLADLPDPLEALLALWDTGYALHDIHTNRGVLTLLLPKP